MEPTSSGFEVIDEGECMALLRSSRVGRIAVTSEAVPAIFPVNYRMVDGRIAFRTGEDSKLRSAADDAVVAFEVDGVGAPSRGEWSVLAVGVAHDVRDPDEAADMAARLPDPWTPGDGDHVVAIVPRVVSGRRVPRAS